MIKLPKHDISLTAKEAAGVLDDYWTTYSAVWDLFDATVGKAHDEITPLDVLSLNALNAWGPNRPMEAMESLWQRRVDVAMLLAEVPTKPAVEMSAAELSVAIETLERTADFVWDLDGWGDTSTAKLLHRMRPSLAPIWDRYVDRFYGMAKADYGDYYRSALDEVLQHADLLKIAVDGSIHSEISIVRAWDILLWTRSPAQHED